MTKEEVIKIAEKYSTLPHLDQLGLAHLRSMPAKMCELEDTDKLMRWLGFMQGALWMAGVYELDELKNHNKFGV